MTGELQAGDPQRIGPYLLLGRLGTSGMGQVFLGRSAGGRLVAVKVIRGELAADEGFRVRFAREVAAARNVSGLFTAPVVDADTDGPTPWLATAYVPGPSLAGDLPDGDYTVFKRKLPVRRTSGATLRKDALARLVRHLEAADDWAATHPATASSPATPRRRRSSATTPTRSRALPPRAA